MALPKLNDTPKYDLVIPSTKQKVRFRPYLVKEEKVLMLAMESKDPKQVINAVVDTILACVYDDIQRKSLKTFDVEYMFLQIRAKSVGETSKFNLKCKSCEANNEVSVDLQSIQIEAPEVNNIIQLTDEVSVKMQYPNYEVLGKIDFENMSDTDQSFYIITKCIHSIMMEDEVLLASDHSDTELAEFIEGLSTSQFLKVRDYLESMPKLQHDVKLKCLSCGEDNEYRLEGIQDFF